jgi:hypothetical protein
MNSKNIEDTIRSDGRSDLRPAIKRAVTEQFWNDVVANTWHDDDAPGRFFRDFDFSVYVWGGIIDVTRPLQKD